MNRSLALWASLAVILALLVTGSVVAVFPLSESRVVQPASIPLKLAAPSSAPVPVSLSTAVVGTITHATLARGGQAAARTSASADSGEVSLRVRPR